jgi:hypothetical protein
VFELGAKTWLLTWGPKIFKLGHLLIVNEQFPIPNSQSTQKLTLSKNFLRRSQFPIRGKSFSRKTFASSKLKFFVHKKL